jgi:outer membrane lipoprotein-sorting protein
MTLALKLVIALMLFTTGEVVVAQSSTPDFDILKSRFEQGNIFIADFSHQYEDAYTGEVNRTGGRIWIGKEKYRVEGDDQIMIVDGKISRVYDGGRNRLIISNYDETEDDYAPSRMLQGVDDSYTVTERRAGNSTIITLTTQDIFAVFSEVRITLNSSGLPQSIEAIDQADNLLRTTFTGSRFGGANSALFELSVPDDAEIIDLRHH